MKETELKSCPFCNGEYDGDYAYCRKCGRRTRLFECFNGTGKTHEDTEVEAINAWNRRADNEQREAD